MKPTQRERVLSLLQERGDAGVKCYEFSLMQPKIMMYVTRIRELRHKQGYNIECKRVRHEGQKYSTYFLRPSTA